MNIYIAGVMQGSVKGQGIHRQGYRQIISEAVQTHHPDAVIYDPYLRFPDSVEYDEQLARLTLFELADTAAATDILIAYLPEASMGSALEMIRAFDHGKTIISISTMEENWFIRAVSAKIFSSLDDFCAWVCQTNLEEMVDTHTE